MNVLLLTYYFEPDLSAGSFRNTPLAYELARQLGDAGTVHVVTTQPNRYQSFRVDVPATEQHGNLRIDRIRVPAHSSGFTSQIWAYLPFYQQALALTRMRTYDVIVASSSRLFSGFLGAYIARQRRVPFVLDVRDLFRENILELRRRLIERVILKSTLSWVERYTFKAARHINLVSAGFDDYFIPYRQATYSHFTNGIDEPFLNVMLSSEGPVATARARIILYAGNIGEGQGLDKIIPEAARQLGDKYQFIVIGDGGTKHRLVKAVTGLGLTNVDIRPPMNRTALLALYQQADYLLMHLNNLKAFERCIPSKLFEYAATNKPLLVGVAGYTAQFVRQHVPNSLIFAPGDVASMVNLLQTTPHQTEVRTAFIERFRRQTISQALASQVLHAAGFRKAGEAEAALPAT